jgi:anti-sigma factor RsiW
MTFCENERVKLDYVNDKLAEEARQAFERHLTTCEDCRNEVTRIRVMASAVRRIPRPTPTPELVEQTQRRLAKITPEWASHEELRVELTRRAIRLSPAVLAPVLIALSLVLLFAVFHEYVAVVLQKTVELSVANLLWGTGNDGSGVLLSIPVVMVLIILAFLLIPSLLENAFSLRMLHTIDAHIEKR